MQTGSANATLAAALSADLAETSAAMAARDDSTPAALAALAVADPIDREAATLAAIERGRADVRAGRTFAQSEVVRDVKAIIDAARAEA